MNVLVVAAHPDDEVLMAGGTIAKFAAEGHAVWIQFLSMGITNEICIGEATRILGAKGWCCEELPDQQLEVLALEHIVSLVENELRKQPYQIVITHSSVDLNRDHRITSEAVRVATRPYTNEILELWEGEVPSSTGYWERPFAPNLYVGISIGQMWRKIEALARYEQKQQFHPRSESGIASLLWTRGSVIRTRYAEAFQVIWRRYD